VVKKTGLLEQLGMSFYAFEQVGLSYFKRRLYKFRSAIIVVGTAAVLSVGSAAASGAAPVRASDDGAVIPLLIVGGTASYSSLDTSKDVEPAMSMGHWRGL
jgi:hypothetical protein